MEPLAGDDPTAIAGYQLRARLGAGGMGRVYLAFTAGGRAVALKVVRPELGDDRDFRERFRQEVAAARRVNGLYTAQVLDADPDARPPWLVTAYVPGPSVYEAVAGHGPLPTDTVLLLMAGIAEALQVIHGAGLVHRDLKPSNVLLAADGPRVIDFGIARAADATSMTRTGMAIGSPGFMAPEQVEGQSATPAVDVFALGAVAAYAALGRSPFGTGNDASILYRIVHTPADLEGCPPALRGLIERCLAKAPAQRPSPAEIIEECRARTAGHTLQIAQAWLPAAVSADLARHLPPTAPPQAMPLSPVPPYPATPQPPAPYPPTPQPATPWPTPQPPAPQYQTPTPPGYQPTVPAGPNWSAPGGTPWPPGPAATPVPPGQPTPIPPGQQGWPGQQGQPGWQAQPGWPGQQGQPPARPRRLSRGVLIGGAVALLLAAGIGGGAAALLSKSSNSSSTGQGGTGQGTTAAGSTTSGSPTTSQSAASVRQSTTSAAASTPANPAACVTGTWRAVDQQVINNINGQQVVFTGSGAVSTFLPNGQITTNYGGEVLSATVDGANWTETLQGVVNGHWAIEDGQIAYSSLKSSGTELLEENGVYNNSGPLEALPSAAPFQCSGNTFRESFPTGGSDQLTRVTSG
jgi:serine/threonine protein kinase